MNIDGASKGNPGVALGGGVLRDIEENGSKASRKTLGSVCRSRLENGARLGTEEVLVSGKFHDCGGNAMRKWMM